MTTRENEMLQAQFDRLCERGHLFRSQVTGQQLWEAYMEGFGEDPVFRNPESSVHNCNTCRHFIERYGNIVALDDELNFMTMWGGETTDEYRESFRRMDDLLSGKPIDSEFIENYDYLNSAPYENTRVHAPDYALGIASNVKQYTEQEAAQFGGVEAGKVYTFHHLMVRLPLVYVSFSHDSVDSFAARKREDRVQLERGLRS